MKGFAHILRTQELLGPHTWFKLGGPAEYFGEPTRTDELLGLVQRCHEIGAPVRILGGGSNLLVREAGVPGLVLHLSASEFSQIRVDGQVVTAGGGAMLGHVISTAVREGLGGLEQLVGIPGTVGGALRGNAAWAGTDVGQWVRRATVMTRAGEVITHERDSMRFSYRHSSLDELVILSAEFELEPESVDELTKRLQKTWIVKKANVPPSNENAGCIFKDVGGASAASLIEAAGLHASTVGRAEVSRHNANFLVARPGATSRELLDLIELLKHGVSDRCGVDLELALEVW
jgi:UDP-N-acetylmuramate dehydrogenase